MNAMAASDPMLLAQQQQQLEDAQKDQAGVSSSLPLEVVA